MKKMLKITMLFFVVFQLFACFSFPKATQYKYKGQVGKYILTNGSLELEILRIANSWRMNNQDYYIEVNVKNNGRSKVKFNTDDFEIIDENGLSYYSIIRGKSSITTPTHGNWAKIITRTTVDPGRKITGFIVFYTGHMKAKSKIITLLWGGNKIKLIGEKQK